MIAFVYFYGGAAVNVTIQRSAVSVQGAGKQWKAVQLYNFAPASGVGPWANRR